MLEVSEDSGFVEIIGAGVACVGSAAVAAGLAALGFDNEREAGCARIDVIVPGDDGLHQVKFLKYLRTC